MFSNYCGLRRKAYAFHMQRTTHTRHDQANNGTGEITWVTAGELARRYRVTRQCITRWAREGLPSIKFNKTRRFDLEKCAAIIEGRTKP